MRFASAAYQHFLVAIKTNQDHIDQIRIVFNQQFEALVSQFRHVADLQSDNKAVIIESSLELQKKINDFYGQFEQMYLTAFKQFKQQQSMLIENNPSKAFKQWTITFDNEYRHFLHQDKVCEDYAEILNSMARLSHQRQALDEVA